jgi:hypothetical protein
MNDREAARSCKSVDRPSWRAASYAIGIDARRAETRISLGSRVAAVPVIEGPIRAARTPQLSV